jgi:hypothetical protein
MGLQNTHLSRHSPQDGYGQCESTDPEFILKALTWASAVSVYGHPKTVNAKLGHLLEVRVASAWIEMAGTTGLEPAASAVTGQRSNQLNYVPYCFSYG